MKKESFIKVGGAELNQTPLDWEGNKNNILRAIEIAKQKEINILCLPELCITGYGCDDMFLASFVQKKAEEILLQIALYTEGILVTLGLPINFKNKVYDSVAVVGNKQILGIVAKKHLPRDGVHYENRWFTPWVEKKIEQIKVEETEVPFGDLYFNISGVRIGLEICEEAWVQDRVGVNLAQECVDIILNPSASHFSFDKYLKRREIVVEGSRAFKTAYIYANLLGNEAGRIIYDGGVTIAQAGNLITESEMLTFHNVKVTEAEVDLNYHRQIRRESTPAQEKLYCVDSNFEITYRREKTTNGQLEKKINTLSRDEQFARAEALGLFDYLRKSKASGYVISLSGGVDSATVLVCCYLMIEYAIEQIGINGFKERLSHIQEIENCKASKEIIHQLITTVYQSTENSGNTTLEAAQSLANFINASFHTIDVNEAFLFYKKTIEKTISREITWEKDDIALQNIQARVRAPGIWMLANIKGALLLSTSNRSEAAVGYATMDGDTSGCLSPLAGINKTFLRKWLVKMEKEGILGIKIPILAKVNSQQPTAELRPKEKEQKDEQDLMPYEVLDYIEKLAIGDKKSPSECYEELKVNHSKYSNEELQKWVDRFFRLWRKNQWKRERYALSFHLDNHSLDPKTWCRFPILSGKF